MFSLGILHPMTSNHYPIKFSDFELHLLKEKAIWSPELKTLFLSDLHFGKAAHFRKSGIPIPEPIHDEDLLKIGSLISTFQPEHFYFLGDLFHSDWNDQWNTLNSFLRNFKETIFHLVKGNHDVLNISAYSSSNFQIHPEPIQLGMLFLSHEPQKQIPLGLINLCGHIHPGIRLVGNGRQSVKLPCFYLHDNQLILPAFGNFTGLALIRPLPGHQVFAVTKEKVIAILSRD